MKKLIFILFALYLVTGCGNRSNGLKLDLEDIAKRVDELTYLVDDSEVVMFDRNQHMTGEVLLNKYDFDTSDMEEFVISMPTMLDSASMYMIVKVKNGKEQSVKKEIDEFFNKYEQQWGLGYAPLEEKRIQDRLETTYEGYLIYIISSDNDKVLSEVKK